MQQIAREFPRTFVPQEANLGNWAEIEPLFQQLLERAIDSPEALERWILDWSELAAALSEERSRRYIAMTCNTEDAENERRYLRYIQEVEPKIKPMMHRLNQRFAACEHRSALPRACYAVMERNVLSDVALFREENVPLQAEEATLGQQYQKRFGAMMVEFDGRPHTLPQMARYLEETDRARRQAAWETVTRRVLEEREPMDALFDRLVALRHRVARNAGHGDYRTYIFQLYHRFDYTPADSERFQQGVQEVVVPLARRLAEERRAVLGVPTLRPWDLDVDPKGRAPLRPFQNVAQLCEGVQRVFQELEPALAGQFMQMRARGELDLESRQGKAPGGYLDSLEEVRRPFIFMNATGVHRDVETLLHESGHAFHALAARCQPVFENRAGIPLEFAEVASMAMELFGMDCLSVFYKPEDVARAKRQHLEGVIGFLPWMARIDAFQHWAYAHPDHTREKRTACWLELDGRFGRPIDWSGCEEARAASWQRQRHVFLYPFYYVEYGIAQLGALQLWRSFLDAPKETLRNYRAALALGNTRPLPDLFGAAGAKFDLSEKTLRPLMAFVEEELAQLPE